MSNEWQPGRDGTGDPLGHRFRAGPDQYRQSGPGEDTAEWQRIDWPDGSQPTEVFNAFGSAEAAFDAGHDGYDAGYDPRFDGSGFDSGFDPRFDVALDPALAESDPAPLVRPYARTGGRTRASQDLALETLVSVTDLGRTSAPLLSADQAAICGLCETPISVAEVGARLRVPLGVARVLLSDLAADAMIVVHDSAVHAGDAPSLDFMERVLVGLRNL